MSQASIRDAVRTPTGRLSGSLSTLSGARIAMRAVEELHRSRGRHALAFMCIGVGQGIAMIVERV